MIPEANHGLGGAQQAPDGQATPEEQDLMENFLARCVLLIHSEDMRDDFREMLEDAPDIVDGIAEVGAMVINQVRTMAEESGQEIDDQIILHVGGEIGGILAEFAEAGGLGEVTDQQIEAAIPIGADKYRRLLAESGKLDEEAYKGKMQAFIDADNSGDLEQMFAIPPEEEMQNG